MIKSCFNAIILILLSAIFFSCKKNSSGPSNIDNTLLISVNSLIAIQDADWNSIEPQLSDKRGYWYTEFPEEQNAGIKAAVSLPAYDTSNGLKINCHILLNVSRQSNKIVTQIMDTNDTLSPLSREQAFALESYYYTNGLKFITDTTQTQGFYDDTTGIHWTTSVVDVFSKLKANYDTPEIGMVYFLRPAFSSYIIVCFKNPDNDRYTFSFRGD